MPIAATRSGSSLRAQLMHLERDYFPQWDRAQTWRIRSRPLLGSYYAYVDFPGRTIYLATRTPSDVMLIHVLADAASGRSDHDDAWRARMLEAVGRASRLGERDLVDQILSDAAWEYGKTGAPAWVLQSMDS